MVLYRQSIVWEIGNTIPIFNLNQVIVLFLHEIRNTIPMYAKKIGKFIQYRRELLMLKQEDLSEMSGIAPKTIYLIEQGIGNPTLNTLQKIFNVLGIELLLRTKKTDV